MFRCTISDGRVIQTRVSCGLLAMIAAGCSSPLSARCNHGSRWLLPGVRRRASSPRCGFNPSAPERAHC